MVISGVRIERLDIELPQLLEQLGPGALNWRWLLADVEFWLRPSASRSQRDLVATATHESVWLSGQELMDLALQVSVPNWGVMLAFSSEDTEVTFDCPPRSEGYNGPIQHPQAILEVRAVDGGYFEVLRL
jgi:hypothetical protein